MQARPAKPRGLSDAFIPQGAKEAGEGLLSPRLTWVKASRGILTTPRFLGEREPDRDGAFVQGNVFFQAKARTTMTPTKAGRGWVGGHRGASQHYKTARQRAPGAFYRGTPPHTLTEETPIGFGGLCQVSGLVSPDRWDAATWVKSPFRKITK